MASFISTDTASRYRIRYSTEDGLIDGGVRTVVKDKQGHIWVGGQHGGKSGIARYDGRRWRRWTTEDGLVGTRVYTGLAAKNGDVWFGTKGIRPVGHGVMRYDGRSWTTYTTDDGLSRNMIYTLAQTTDGAIWAGTISGVNRFDGTRWTSFMPGADTALHHDKIRTVCADTEGNLWVGHGEWAGGVIKFDGRTWTQYTTQDGLTSNRVYKIHQSIDGSLWIGNSGGLNRLDGETWRSYVAPIALGPGGIAALGDTPDGALWVGLAGTGGRRVIARFMPDPEPPNKNLIPAVDRVSSLGNILLRWQARDLWDDTPPEKLLYQWRTNAGDWSPLTKETDVTLTSLTPGDYTFEVRSQDGDGNFDPTPATHAFVVEAPWWQNPWVAGSALVMLGLIGIQSGRLVQRDRRLRESNDALSGANNELFQVNVDLESTNVQLQREQVLERLRGQAQGMQSSEDIRPVVEALHQELTELGLPLINSGFAIRISEMENEIWITDGNGRALEPFILERNEIQRLTEMVEARRRGDDYYQSHREGEEVKESLRWQNEHGNPGWKNVPEEQWPQKIDSYVVFFEGDGSVFVNFEEPVDEGYLVLIRRFGEVFGFAHQRWEELQLKEDQNRRLVVDGAVARIRAEAQAMDRVEDFERVLSTLSDDLKGVGLEYDTCGIDVLEEPIERPTVAHFEQNGFRYTTFSIDPQGNVKDEAFQISAPFPLVVRETVERFAAGDPWQGKSGDTAIVEVPASSYGRLRLTSTERDSFTDEEVATLQEFAQAIALGYRRYLDIREIQEQTERKSAFLASMSHELRTPMNAIKGFTNLVLGRRSENLNDRQRENLGKVSQASDHLLAMINDLLDLSKIEAGRMDVNVESFDVKDLIASCCDTVSPLIQEGVTLRQDVAGDIGEANTDRARVQQMVINLLSNSIKFTEIGMVTVTAARGQGSREQGGRPRHRGERYGEGHSRRRATHTVR